jgi:hypothetical protein
MGKRGGTAGNAAVKTPLRLWEVSAEPYSELLQAISAPEDAGLLQLDQLFTLVV